MDALNATTREKATRLLTPPLGWPFAPRVVTVRPAERQRRLIILNRYPGQVIGVQFRLPSIYRSPSFHDGTLPVHLSLSIVWSKPARWWKR